MPIQDKLILENLIKNNSSDLTIEQKEKLLKSLSDDLKKTDHDNDQVLKINSDGQLFDELEALPVVKLAKQIVQNIEHKKSLEEKLAKLEILKEESFDFPNLEIQIIDTTHDHTKQPDSKFMKMNFRKKGVFGSMVTDLIKTHFNNRLKQIDDEIRHAAKSFN